MKNQLRTVVLRPSALAIVLGVLFFAGVPYEAVLSAQDRGLKVVAREITSLPNFEVGRQIAVIIGIDRYQKWTPLKNAVAEAKEFKRILAEGYYFDEFIELYDNDASVSNIRKLFSQTLPAKVGVHDSLLIFYAGHGYLDDSKSGFWIPVDGGTDTLEQNAWLANAQLRNYLGQLKAQRLLVVADSCFSGDLLNTSRGALPTIDSAYYKQALQLSSRQVLSSGASETVPDESEFAKQLLGFLERNTEPLIDTLTIYDQVRRGVGQTLPLFGTLPGNQQGSSFIFFKKRAETIVETTSTTISQKPAVALSTSRIRGTVDIKNSKPNYVVRVRSADNSNGSYTVLKEATELEPGTYSVVARIQDDILDTWSGKVTVEPGKAVQIDLPVVVYSKDYQINQLRRERSTFESSSGAGGSFAKVLGWVSFGLGLVGTGLGVVGLIDGTQAKTAYDGATASNVELARSRVEVDSFFVTLSLPIGGGLLLLSPFLLSEPDSSSKIGNEDKIREIDRKIKALSQ